MSVSVRIDVPPEIGKWARGFASLPVQMAARGLPVWQAATEVFFAETQRVVHVITGELKSSGKMSTKVSGGAQLVGEVAYTAPYAIFEEKRGGDHAFMTRGWEATEHVFREAMPEIYQQVVRSWR